MDGNSRLFREICWHVDTRLLPLHFLSGIEQYRWYYIDLENAKHRPLHVVHEMELQACLSLHVKEYLNRFTGCRHTERAQPRSQNQRMMFSLRPRRNKNDQQALCRSRGKQIYPKSGTTIDLFQVFIFSWDFNCLPFLGMTIIAKIEEYNPAFHILERGQSSSKRLTVNFLTVLHESMKTVVIECYRYRYKYLVRTFINMSFKI